MMTIRINKSELKVCESTAKVAVLNATETDVNDIAELITSRNYTCAVIYTKDQTAAQKLFEQVGGEPTDSYDRFYAYVCNFS